MSSVDENVISEVLMVTLGLLIFILITLVVILFVLKVKETGKKNKSKKIKVNNKAEIEGNKTEFNKKSIFDFMEFDKIEDNMIVQKNGKRYLMAIECQGVNYDLMSRMEKIGVEEGFQQFLNTLRHPVQIYIQTRTINLEGSISKYKNKVSEIEDKYNHMLYKYNIMRDSDEYSDKEIDEYEFELTKQRNLLEYGKDIVSNTEKMSLNRSILNKKYYLIISYFAEESNGEKYDREEIKNMAFSELYTKAQSMIRTLSSCSISGKVLTTQELVDLLYVAYNRDESERFGIDKAMMAGYDDLYVTAPDVYEKKIKVLNEIVRDRAIEMANQTIEKVKSKPQRIAQEKEDNLDELVKKMAAIIIEENRRYVGEDIAREAVEEINNSEGGEKHDQIKKKTTRGRKKKTVN